MATTSSQATALRQRHRLGSVTNNVNETDWSASQVMESRSLHKTGKQKSEKLNFRRELTGLCSILLLIVSSICLLLFSIQLRPIKKHLIFNPLTNLAIRYGYETSDAAKRYLEISLSEFSDGGCRDVILIFARGTGEPGNMVNSSLSFKS